MPDDRDKVTVGVTPDGAVNLAALMESGWFTDEIDAYRLAIATAFGEQLNVDAVVLAGVQTKYNIGTLDRDGKVSAMVRAFSPEAATRPFEYSERLADAGLRYLKTRIVDQGLLLADALASAPRA